MAAYAAVVSLMNTMEAIMNHSLLSTSLHKQQIQSLGKQLDVLLEFIENYNPHERDQEAECLERNIAYAVHLSEDTIEAYIGNHIQYAGALEEGSSFFIDLQIIIQSIELVKEEVVKFIGKRRSSNEDQQQQPRYSYSKTAAASSQPATTGKTTMVGFDGYLNQLLDGLTGNSAYPRKVISIVGMGGVGKSTLARNAYENLFVMQYFDARAWVSISQQYNVRTILIQLLCSLGQSTIDIDEKVEDRLIGERLCQFLRGRRYLIVLDDVWSFEVWHKIAFFIPPNLNSSRIIVTTRLLEVARDYGSSKIVGMDLLDDTKSWELFCEKAFNEEGCSSAELEQVGKRIVKKCKGFPFSIVMIGYFLGKSPQSREYWEKMNAKNISSILNSAGNIDQCLDRLFLSYKHLPAHLKPCFLHLGMFPEDHEIKVSRLIKLWVGEGFIRPNKYQSMEEVAEGYINDLFERSLILVPRLGWNKKFETFKIHHLVRDMCLREAQKEKFFCVTKRIGKRQGIDRQRRIVIRDQENAGRGVFHNLRATSTARLLICERGEPLFESEVLRVVVVNYVDRSYFPSNAFQLVNMRLLAYETDLLEVFFEHTISELPRSIFQIWNLQSLIVSNSQLEAPLDIWKLPYLRHVDFWSVRLPEPPSSDGNDFVLHNLQTLMTVKDLMCSEEVCRRIPNVKRLQVRYQDFSEELLLGKTSSYCLQNIRRLSKVESLCYYFEEVPDRDHLLQKLKFPTSLKELSLWNCGLDWDEDMWILSSLPHLEVLKLHWGSFVGGEWNSVEGGFLGLKYLGIYDYTLEEWNADSSHFPVLDTLFLGHLSELEEIPPGIGDIPTLRVIRLDSCSISVAVSAMRILEEQESQGNDDLQIQVKVNDTAEREKFMEQVEEEGISCRNLKLDAYI